jgi:hypothetical protein
MGHQGPVFSARRHTDRHTKTEKRHAGVMGVSQKSVTRRIHTAILHARRSESVPKASGRTGFGVPSITTCRHASH